MTPKLGTIVMYRHINDPAKERTIHFLPAIVTSIFNDGIHAGNVGLHVFRSGNGVMTASPVSYEKKGDRMHTWCTREDYREIKPRRNDFEFATPPGLHPAKLPHVNVGDFVEFRHGVDAGTWNNNKIAGPSRVSPAIIRAIGEDGKVSLSIFTSSGVEDPCPADSANVQLPGVPAVGFPYNSNTPGCWFVRRVQGSGSLCGTLTQFSFKVPSSGHWADRRDDDGDTKFVALVRDLSPLDGSISLSVFTSEGVIDPGPVTSTEAGDLWFPKLSKVA